MRLLKELSRKEFQSKYGTKEQCLAHLVDLKWSDGYKCKRCYGEQFIAGKQLYARRCKKCGYDESPTANTLFHKVKFGVENAFEMLYDITTSKKGANSIWLAERFGVRQTTAWLFRKKAQLVMKSSKKHLLTGDVHVDEFEIGTPQKGEQGRSKSEKKVRVVIALEHRTSKCGRGYAKIIEDYSAKSLRPIFTEHISVDANILADKWTGYIPLKASYPNMRQIKSEKGRNFPMVHQQIRNLKNWLRGVHSYCDKKYLEEYLNEYFFRFNRRNHRQSILSKEIERMANHEPMTFKELKISET